MESPISLWHGTQGFKRGAAIGALILTFAGAAWAVAGLVNWPGTPVWEFGFVAVPVLALTGLSISRLVAVAALPSPQVPDAEAAENARRGRRIGLLFGAVFTVEMLLIALAAILLSSAGRPLLIPVAVAAIVGVHFLPLATIFHVRTYGIAGLLLIGASLGSLFVPDEPTRVYVLALMVAMVLWASAGTVLAMHTGRQSVTGAT